MAANSLRTLQIIPPTTYNTVGLVNAATYGFLANGTLVRLSGFDAGSIQSSGLSEGNGIYFTTPDATQLVLGVAPAALTSGAGISFSISNVFYPLITSASGTAFTNGATAVPIAASTSTLTRYSLRPGSSDNGTTTAVNRVFIPLITATTWPASAGNITISLEMY